MWYIVLRRERVAVVVLGIHPSLLASRFHVKDSCTNATSLYSDMNGIGSFMYWCYQGSEPIGPIETYWGTLPQLNQLLQETYESIQPGSCGGRTGGILLPGGFFMSGESKAGDRVQVALKVRTGDKEFGAVISFTLIQGPSGFEPINISVTPLQENGG